ncbi:MAG: hypothetical protein AB8B72_09410 [Crocinitomicaceae bacterium]
MKISLLFYSLIIVSISSNAQGTDNGFEKSIGLDLFQTSQIKGAIDRTKISPYIAFKRGRRTVGVGISTGKKNIVEPFAEGGYSGNGNYAVDGGFGFYRFSILKESTAFNPYLEFSVGYLQSEARMFGEFYQNVHTIQKLIKGGINYSMHQKLSLNFAVGIGMNSNFAEEQFYFNSNEEEGWQIQTHFYDRFIPAMAVSLGLQYHFIN